MMRIDILTIFPGMFESPFRESILKIAQDKGLLEIYIHDVRDYTHNKHRQVDDYSYGGGPGMVMKPEPIFEAVLSLLDGKLANIGKLARVILLSPRGKRFDQEFANELSREKRLLLICGRYEGVDERVHEIVSDEISIGDYILSGGELAAMVLTDTVARLIPGVVGKEKSVAEESFAEGLLEHPHYTRPAEFMGMRVPEVLLSGDHAAISRWRREKSLETTFLVRPDLLEKARLAKEDLSYLEKFKRQRSRGK
ncbi:MAG: tRNA (guanosine(37)-N1)-methyltransferase TrmD [Actinomycetota bacterium]